MANNVVMNELEDEVLLQAVQRIEAELVRTSLNRYFVYV
jgi:hypothetical protein